MTPRESGLPLLREAGFACQGLKFRPFSVPWIDSR